MINPSSVWNTAGRGRKPCKENVGHGDGHPLERQRVDPGKISVTLDSWLFVLHLLRKPTQHYIFSDLVPEAVWPARLLLFPLTELRLLLFLPELAQPCLLSTDISSPGLSFQWHAGGPRVSS